MRIAATITAEGYIEKLPDGPYIIIFDTQKKILKSTIIRDTF